MLDVEDLLVFGASVRLFTDLVIFSDLLLPERQQVMISMLTGNLVLKFNEKDENSQVKISGMILFHKCLYVPNVHL